MSEMYSRIETITPEVAMNYLMKSKGNRPINSRKVTEISSDIRNGNWDVTHQGIAFDSNGVLIDGHHRLTAVASVGIPVKMLVIYNAPNSVKIDAGMKRRERDALLMAGVIDKESMEYAKYTLALVSFIATINYGKTARTITAIEKHNIYQHIKVFINPALRIAHKGCTGRSRSAAVLYAMSCAYKAGVTSQLLEKWHHILSTGDFYSENDDRMTQAGRSILLLKNFLDNSSVRALNANDYEIKEVIIPKVMSSIRHYSEKRPIARLYGEHVYSDIVIEPSYLLPMKEEEQ